MHKNELDLDNKSTPNQKKQVNFAYSLQSFVKRLDKDKPSS